MSEESSEDITRPQKILGIIMMLPVIWFLLLIISPGWALAWIAVAALAAAVVVYPDRAVAEVQRFVSSIDVELPPVIEILRQSQDVMVFIVLSVIFFVLIGVVVFVIVDVTDWKPLDGRDDEIY